MKRRQYFHNFTKGRISGRDSCDFARGTGSVWRTARNWPMIRRLGIGADCGLRLRRCSAAGYPVGIRTRHWRMIGRTTVRDCTVLVPGVGTRVRDGARAIRTLGMIGGGRRCPPRPRFESLLRSTIIIFYYIKPRANVLTLLIRLGNLNYLKFEFELDILDI